MSDPAQLATEIVDDLHERAREAFDEFGHEVLDALRESVSVPVTYIGSRAIRSAPGEPPRREFADYLGSLGAELTFIPAGVSTTIFTDMLRGRWLELGTKSILPRPHWKPIFDRYATLAAEAIGRRMFSQE